MLDPNKKNRREHGGLLTQYTPGAGGFQPSMHEEQRDPEMYANPQAYPPYVVEPLRPSDYDFTKATSPPKGSYDAYVYFSIL